MSKQFKISLAVFAYLLVWYGLLRLGFFLANRQFFIGTPSADIIKAFVHGPRFDIAALLLVNGALLLIYNIPGNPSRWRPLRILLLGLFWAANIAGLLLNLADYGYYPTIQRRMTFELFAIPGDILRMVPGLLAEYWLLFLLLTAMSALFIWSSLRLLRRADQRIIYRFHPGPEVFSLLLLLALAVLGIRGGLQSKPLKPAHAFFSNNWALGYLTLNSTYTVVRSSAQPVLPRIQVMAEAEAGARVEKMIRAGNEAIVDPRYPFLRVKSFTQPMRRMNVVVIVLESWMAGQVGAVSGNPGSTPFFDSLAGAGLLFINFLANAQRSIESAPAILASMPGLSNNTLISSQSETARFIGLGTVLRRRGYSAAFYHGAKTGSMGFDAFARMAGFPAYFGKEDYPGLCDSVQDGAWGLYDEYAFRDALRRMNGMREPFCMTFYAMQPHDPLKIPENRQALFAQFKDDTKYQRALRYADHCLKTFFDQAREQLWFGNTLFVLAGDHTTSPLRNDFRSIFHVPLLLYAPGLLGPGRDGRIASQVDILPTVMDLLRIPGTHASMGRSLLESAVTRFAVVGLYPNFALYGDTLVLMADLDHIGGLYDYRADPGYKINLKDARPALAREMHADLAAYVQEVSNAMVRDRICRSEDAR